MGFQKDFVVDFYKKLNYSGVFEDDIGFISEIRYIEQKNKSFSFRLTEEIKFKVLKNVDKILRTQNFRIRRIRVKRIKKNSERVFMLSEILRSRYLSNPLDGAYFSFKHECLETVLEGLVGQDVNLKDFQVPEGLKDGINDIYTFLIVERITTYLIVKKVFDSLPIQIELMSEERRFYSLPSQDNFAGNVFLEPKKGVLLYPKIDLEELRVIYFRLRKEKGFIEVDHNKFIWFLIGNGSLNWHGVLKELGVLILEIEEVFSFKPYFFYQKVKTSLLFQKGQEINITSLMKNVEQQKSIKMDKEE